GGMVDRRCRVAGAGVCDRGRGVGGAGAGWQADEHGDRGSRSDGGTAQRISVSAGAGNDRIARLLRAVAPEVLGAVVRRFRAFGASEDAVQEALIAAATQWPSEGVPEEPRAWLIRVAARRI